MRTLPRERFVPPRLSLLAYMDESVEVFPAIDGAPARFLLRADGTRAARPARRGRARR